MLPQISPFEFGENTVNTGDVVMALCTVPKGDLPIEISWSINGKLVKKMDGISLSQTKRSSQISIDSVYFEHAGEYTCTAKNSIGSSSYSAILNVNGIYLENLYFIRNILVYIVLCFV